MPGPRQVLGDDVGRARAAGQRGQAQVEPVVVEGQQLVDPLVRATGTTGPWAGQDPQVGQRPHLGERRHEVAEWQGRRRRHGEADRRGDRRQHVVAREQHPLGLLGEDEVTGRVPRRVDGVDGAVADLDPVVALEPGRRERPQARGRGARPRSPGSTARPPRGAPAVTSTSMNGLRSRLWSLSELQRRLLAETERDLRAVLVTQDGGQREVVAVHVGDQEPADVAEAVADLLQAAVEQLARLGDRPAAVDQGQPVRRLDDVDVDRLQPVHRQRQRIRWIPSATRQRPRHSSGSRSPGRSRGRWRWNWFDDGTVSDPRRTRPGTRGRGSVAGSRRRSRGACR